MPLMNCSLRLLRTYEFGGPPVSLYVNFIPQVPASQLLNDSPFICRRMAGMALSLPNYSF